MDAALGGATLRLGAAPPRRQRDMPPQPAATPPSAPAPDEGTMEVEEECEPGSEEADGME